MISDRIFIEAQLARLAAAFPTFRLADSTRALYVEKLLTLDADDLGYAIEFFIERGKKYPTIGQLIERAHNEGAERRKRENARAQIDSTRRDRTEMPEWTQRYNSALFSENLERGRRDADEHRRKVLAQEDMHYCQCLDCRFRNGRLIYESGKVREGVAL